VKFPGPPTDAQLAQLRSAIAAILDLPSQGRAAIVLVPFAVDGGDDTGLRMLTLGITSEFATVVLLKAANITATEEPVKQGIYDPKQRD